MSEQRFYKKRLQTYFQLLATFAKIENSDYELRHVCLSVLPSAWNH